MRTRADFVAFAALLLATGAARAQMGHHQATGGTCGDATLACASAATPAFAPDGSLWLAWAAGGRVSVAHSTDLGHSFSPAVAVDAAPEHLDTGPDSRPAIVVAHDGVIVVAYAIFKDAHYNGEVFFTRSRDGGRSFAPPAPITASTASQRFAALAFDPEGALFAAWLDKRDVAPARAAGKVYPGAALAYAWSHDKGGRFAPARIAADDTCECCRIAVAFAGPGRPVVLFRNIFGGTVRDHGVITFRNSDTPGPLYRVSVDDWKIDACPHHGPSLAIGADGTYHAAWFTEGRVRQGLFYARSTDKGRTFSTPRAIGDPTQQLSRPYVLAVPGAIWLAWKAFDGEHARVLVMASRDDGRNWGRPMVAAETADASDHPLLVSRDGRPYLSWLTHAEGYRLLPLGEKTR